MPTISETPSRYDYEADETLVVSETVQLRALADDVRAAIVYLLRAGLIHVVRTRRVRAVTEKFYGRTARLFLFRTEDAAEERALAATMLRRAASEVECTPEVATFGHVQARVAQKDMLRFERRLKRLMDDFRVAESPDGTPCAFAAVLYKRTDA